MSNADDDHFRDELVVVQTAVNRIHQFKIPLRVKHKNDGAFFLLPAGRRTLDVQIVFAAGISRLHCPHFGTQDRYWRKFLYRFSLSNDSARRAESTTQKDQYS